jgi:hypothetical protein
MRGFSAGHWWGRREGRKGLARVCLEEAVEGGTYLDEVGRKKSPSHGLGDTWKMHKQGGRMSTSSPEPLKSTLSQ